MEDIIRFMMHRPPQRADVSVAVSVEETTTFQAELLQARNGDSPRQEIKTAAQRFISSQTYVKELSSLHYHTPLQVFFERLTNGSINNLEELKVLIVEIFGQEARIVSGDANFINDRKRLSDSIIAIVLIPTEQPNLDGLVRTRRLCALIERAGADDQSLNEEGAIQKSLRRTIVLPGELFPIPSSTERLRDERTLRAEATQVDEQSKLKQQLEEKARALESAIQELRGIKYSDFKMGDLPTETTKEKKAFSASAARKSKGKSSLTNESNILPSSTVQPTVTPLTLKSEAVERFDLNTKKVLEELRLDLTRVPIHIIVLLPPQKPSISPV